MLRYWLTLATNRAEAQHQQGCQDRGGRDGAQGAVDRTLSLAPWELHNLRLLSLRDRACATILDTTGLPQAREIEIPENVRAMAPARRGGAVRARIARIAMQPASVARRIPRERNRKSSLEAHSPHRAWPPGGVARRASTRAWRVRSSPGDRIPPEARARYPMLTPCHMACMSKASPRYLARHPSVPRPSGS